MLNKETADSGPHLASTLFSMIRARYVIVVEDILESEPVAGVMEAILDEFKAKHRSGAFFCRHSRCPRAAQGYDTPELRQMHEESHVPNFQCTEMACGLFGWPFNTQAAFKKHITQYHDKEKIASIPDSLTNVRDRSHKDRSLFILTESKEQRRVEESSSPGTPSVWQLCMDSIRERTPLGNSSFDNDDNEFSRAIVNENNNDPVWQLCVDSIRERTPSANYLADNDDDEFSRAIVNGSNNDRVT